MNTNIIRLSVAAGLLALTSLASAHDPAEHAKEAAAAKAGPDCASMDHSKIDMNDPVAKAMMAKCGSPAGKTGDMKGMDHSKMAPSDASKPAAHGQDHRKGG